MIGISSGCGDDDCTQSDWVGTYDLSDGTCDDPTSSLDDTATITAGSSDDELLFDGTPVNFTDCSASFGLGISFTLDGDVLSVTGLGCSGTYNRR